VILYLKINETESLGIECDKTIYDKMKVLKFKMNVDIERCTNKFSCWYKGNVRLTYLDTTNTRHNSVTGNNERDSTTISFPMKVVEHKKTMVKGETTTIDDFKGKKFWNGGKIHRRRRSKKSKKSKKGTRRR